MVRIFDLQANGHGFNIVPTSCNDNVYLQSCLITYSENNLKGYAWSTLSETFSQFSSF